MSGIDDTFDQLSEALQKLRKARAQLRNERKRRKSAEEIIDYPGWRCTGGKGACDCKQCAMTREHRRCWPEGT